MKKHVILGHVFGKATLLNKYHQGTSLNKLDNKLIPVSSWPEAWKRVHYKEYPRFRKFPLQVNKLLLDGEFSKALLSRVSSRDLGQKTITFEQLSTLLHYSLGIRTETADDFKTARRYYPSAGARFPIETYILVGSDGVEGLSNFSYHLNIKRSLLELMFSLSKKDIQRMFNQEWIFDADILVCFSAVFDRSKVKYGDRSYRYCLIEAGHCAQNIYLLCSQLGLKCCAIGGYSDTAINSYLELDKNNEAVIYVVAVGK